MVMPNKVAEMKVAAGAGTEEGRRPTVVPAPAAIDPELVERAPDVHGPGEAAHPKGN